MFDQIHRMRDAARAALVAQVSTGHTNARSREVTIWSEPWVCSGVMCQAFGDGLTARRAPIAWHIQRWKGWCRIGPWHVRRAFVEAVESVFPGCVWTVPNDAGEPCVALLEGEPVGLVMVYVGEVTS
jgi:hypothetical protein